MHYYKTCDDLPIYNFYKIMEESNYMHLIVGYDGYQDIKIEHEDIESVWQDIHEEYVKMSGDNSTKLYYELINEVLYLETRYKVVMDLLSSLAENSMSDQMISAYIKELRQWKYKIDDSKPFEDEMDKMVRQLKASENKIRLKKDELEKLKENNNDGESMSLIKQTVKLEQALERNNIDTKKTSVTKWIALLEEIKEINAQRQKNNGK
jgi:hypothetical protein